MSYIDVRKTIIDQALIRSSNRYPFNDNRSENLNFRLCELNEEYLEQLKHLHRISEQAKRDFRGLIQTSKIKEAKAKQCY
jgi:hypothetical protein